MLKTLDSLETKIEQVRVAYQQFYTTMGIENVWKGALDALKSYINTLNSLPKLFGKIPVNAIASIMAIVNLIKGIATKALESFAKSWVNAIDAAKGEAKTASAENKTNGENWANAFINGIRGKINEIKGVAQEAVNAANIEANNNINRQLITSGQVTTDQRNNWLVTLNNTGTNGTDVLNDDDLTRWSQRLTGVAHQMTQAGYVLKPFTDDLKENRQMLIAAAQGQDIWNESTQKIPTQLNKLETTTVGVTKVLKQYGSQWYQTLNIIGSAISSLTLLVDTSTRAGEKMAAWGNVTGGITSLGAGVIAAYAGNWPQAISSFISGISSISNAISLFIETEEEQLAKLEKVAEDTANTAKKAKADYNSLNTALEKATHLSKTRYNNSDVEEEYQVAVNSLVESFPQLIQGFDESGNAILNVEAAEQLLIQTRKNSIQATYEAAKAEVARAKQDVKVAQEQANEQLTVNQLEVAAYNELGLIAKDQLQNLIDAKYELKSSSLEGFIRDLAGGQLYGTDHMESANKIIKTFEDSNSKDFLSWLFTTQDIRENKLFDQIKNAITEYLNTNTVGADAEFLKAATQFNALSADTDWTWDQNVEILSNYITAIYNLQAALNTDKELAEKYANYNFDALIGAEGSLTKLASYVDTVNEKNLLWQNGLFSAGEATIQYLNAITPNGKSLDILTEKNANSIKNQIVKKIQQDYLKSGSQLDYDEYVADWYNNNIEVYEQFFDELKDQKLDTEFADLVKNPNATLLDIQEWLNQYVPEYYDSINELFSLDNYIESVKTIISNNGLSINDASIYASQGGKQLLYQYIKFSQLYGDVSSGTEAALAQLYSAIEQANNRLLSIAILNNYDLTTTAGIETAIEALQDAGETGITNALTNLGQQIVENYILSLQAWNDEFSSKWEDELKNNKKLTSGMTSAERQTILKTAKNMGIHEFEHEQFWKILADGQYALTTEGLRIYEEKILEEYEKDLTTRQNVYEQLFDEKGNYRTDIIWTQDLLNKLHLTTTSTNAEKTKAAQLFKDEFLQYQENLELVRQTTNAQVRFAAGQYEDAGIDIKAIAQLADTTRMNKPIEQAAVDTYREAITTFFNDLITLSDEQIQANIDANKYQALGNESIIKANTSAYEFISLYGQYLGKTIEELNDLKIQALSKSKLEKNRQLTEALNDVSILNEKLMYTSLDNAATIAQLLGKSIEKVIDLENYDEALQQYGLQEDILAEFKQLPNYADILYDSTRSYMDGLVEYITGGMKGDLTGTDIFNFAGLLAKYFKDEFAETNDAVQYLKANITRTHDGLKLNQNAILKLLSLMQQVDRISSNIILDDLVQSLKESNQEYITQESTLKRIKELNKLIEQTPVSDTRYQMYKAELSVAKEIYHTRLLNEDDSWDFMNTDMPGAFENPLKFWNAMYEAHAALNKSLTSNRIDYKDYYHVLAEMQQLADTTGQDLYFFGKTIQQGGTQAAALIEEGFQHILHLDDGSEVVDISQIGGLTFNADTLQQTRNQFNQGAAAWISEQKAEVQKLIDIFEVLAKTEELVENFSDQEAQEALQVDQIPSVIGNFITQFLTATQLDEDAQAQLDTITIGQRTLREILNQALIDWGNLSEEEKQAILTIITKFQETQLTLENANTWWNELLSDFISFGTTDIAQENTAGSGLRQLVDNTIAAGEDAIQTLTSWRDSFWNTLREAWANTNNTQTTEAQVQTIQVEYTVAPTSNTGVAELVESNEQIGITRKINVNVQPTPETAQLTPQDLSVQISDDGTQAKLDLGIFATTGVPAGPFNADNVQVIETTINGQKFSISYDGTAATLTLPNNQKVIFNDLTSSQWDTIVAKLTGKDVTAIYDATQGNVTLSNGDNVIVTIPSSKIEGTGILKYFGIKQIIYEPSEDDAWTKYVTMPNGTVIKTTIKSSDIEAIGTLVAAHTTINYDPTSGDITVHIPQFDENGLEIEDEGQTIIIPLDDFLQGEGTLTSENVNIYTAGESTWLEWNGYTYPLDKLYANGILQSGNVTIQFNPDQNKFNLWQNGEQLGKGATFTLDEIGELISATGEKELTKEDITLKYDTTTNAFTLTDLNGNILANGIQLTDLIDMTVTASKVLGKGDVTVSYTNATGFTLQQDGKPVTQLSFGTIIGSAIGQALISTLIPEWLNNNENIDWSHLFPNGLSYDTTLTINITDTDIQTKLKDFDLTSVRYDLKQLQEERSALRKKYGGHFQLQNTILTEYDQNQTRYYASKREERWLDEFNNKLKEGQTLLPSELQYLQELYEIFSQVDEKVFTHKNLYGEKEWINGELVDAQSTVIDYIQYLQSVNADLTATESSQLQAISSVFSNLSLWEIAALFEQLSQLTSQIIEIYSELSQYDFNNIIELNDKWLQVQATLDAIKIVYDTLNSATLTVTVNKPEGEDLTSNEQVVNVQYNGVTELFSSLINSFGSLNEESTNTASKLNKIVKYFEKIENSKADARVGKLQLAMTGMPDSASKVGALKTAMNQIPDVAYRVQSLVDSLTTLTKTPLQLTLAVDIEGAATVKGTNANVFTNKHAYWGSTNIAVGGIGRAKGTLMGELGPELYVQGGRYYIAGRYGAEFVNLADDAIVFNHLQTKKLLSNSYSGRGRPVTNERTAVAFAKGGEGPAKAGARQTLADLKQLLAILSSLETAASRDLGKKAGLGGGNGGGGGGGGNTFNITTTSKELERWYNLLQQIERIEEDITYQEQLRSKLESDRTVNAQAYYQSQKESLELLNQEVQRHAQLADEQQAYLDKLRTNLTNDAFYKQIYEIDKQTGALQYKSGAVDLFTELQKTDATGQFLYSAQQQYEELLKRGWYDTKVLYDDSGVALFTDALGNAMTTLASDGKYYKKSTTDKGETKIEEMTAEEINTAMENVMKNIWEAIDTTRDEITEVQGTVDEQLKAVLESEEQRNEILQNIEDNVIDVETKVYDAVENFRQNAIDEIHDQRDALSDTNQAFIDGLSEELNKEREMYSKNESASELTKLQRQLAILQRSGGSASAIRSLQDQISSKQQDMYFDTRQQQIDAIKEASDNELERLDKQIDLMEEQLDFDKENGLLWKEVSSVLSLTEAEIADFIHKNDKDYKTKSITEQEKINREDLLSIGQFTNYRDDTSKPDILNDLTHDWDAYYEYIMRTDYSQVWTDANGNATTTQKAAKAAFAAAMATTGDENEARAAANRIVQEAYNKKYPKKESEPIVTPTVEPTPIKTSEPTPTKTPTNPTTTIPQVTGTLTITYKKLCTSGKAMGQPTGGNPKGPTSLAVGETGKIEHNCNSGFAKGGWKISDPSKCDIMGNTITAKAPGKVTIIFYYWDRRKDAHGYSFEINGEAYRKEGFESKNVAFEAAKKHYDQIAQQEARSLDEYLALLADKNAKIKAYNTGGLADYTGLAIVHGSKTHPEAFLDAETTRVWKEKILNGNNSLTSILSNLYDAWSDMNKVSAYEYSTTEDNHALDIGTLNFSMNVESINDKYGAQRAARDAMDEIMSIARKSGTRSLQRG